jgi:hypothetical protein
MKDFFKYLLKAKSTANFCLRRPGTFSRKAFPGSRALLHIAKKQFAQQTSESQIQRAVSWKVPGPPKAFY